MLDQNESSEENIQNEYYLLIESIDLDSCKNLVEWILFHNLSDNPPDILNLIICSPGGDLDAAFSVIDMMFGSQIPIRTIGMGQVCSAGLSIFIAGTKGYRILSPNTSILSHQYSAGTEGKSHELIFSVRGFENLHNKLIKHYADCTNLSNKTIEEKLLPPHDIWLTSHEAMALGLCDKVENISISSYIKPAG